MLHQALLSRFSSQEVAFIQKAIDLLAHVEAQESGRPHGVEVAVNLQGLNVDSATLLAAILSDYRLVSYPIEAEFGSVVASIVQNVAELNALNVYSKEIAAEASQVEILRRMLLSLADDIRAVLIKLAYRLARLKKLAREEPEIRHFIAQETLDLYAPIANRLGIGQLKWELEDYAFRYLNPESYVAIAKDLESKRIHREECIADFIEILAANLKRIRIDAGIKGRPKHIYSIWQKMQRKKLPIQELYDLLAVRVIVNSTAECYEVLGMVHQHWTFIPKEFDDYIANPKNNGYQSLHTVILDRHNNRIEVQIRTQEMHEFAELGVAAHWRYKEGSKQDKATEKSIASLRQLLEETDGETLLANFRTELFSDRVYVLTPAGKLIDLIKGATPLDFAYAIHTDLGHRCRGAKVNGRIVPLTYTLQTGEQVEVLTVNEIAPNPNWIDAKPAYLQTPRAIQKVKLWLNQQGREKHILMGQQLVEKSVQRLGIKGDYLAQLIQHFACADAEKLWVSLGRGTINERQLNHALKVIAGLNKKVNSPKPAVAGKAHTFEITVAGTNNILTHFAQCCQPDTDDKLIGFITHGHGIAIHKASCDNISQLNEQQRQQLVAVSLRVNKE